MDKTPGDFTVHVVGLGLMGGSLAMALRDRCRRITADDVNPDVLRTAQAQGVIDGVGLNGGADVVVLAIPANQLVELIPQLSIPAGTLVIDLGSTKTRICAQLDRLPGDVFAVGGHPMCGLAENGYANAIPTLYKGAHFVLCETARTTDAARQQAEALACAVGAVPLWMDREQHDYLTALTSHLPHLLSFALMRLAMNAADEDPALYDLAAGGFDGATRLARTNADMITGMFSTNADQLRRLLPRLRAELEHFETLLDNVPGLQQDLGEIVQARRAYTASHGERPIS
ncbi:prephenate dehydrogenase [Aggregatilinea lenta]|uniref:prephenate dehydrogenase n=1 Tax=Aggregatilinea lenta TaxID=913108 RepID=UPI000E5AF6B4|nr:prephenate dehydrogenase [Aggregatilinea lenta]